MPLWKNRTCERCGDVSFTASKAIFCQLCQMANKRDIIVERESEDLVRWGYTKLEGPTLDAYNHRVYKVLTKCNHEWTAPYNNIRKQILNAESKNLQQPCPKCGPQRRMKVALDGYMDKYARDYDLKVYEDYCSKVRRISDKVFKENEAELNPHGYKRRLAGVEGAYHLDHKVPIIKCFKEGWTPEQAAAKENLALLPAGDNLTKGSK